MKRIFVDGKFFGHHVSDPQELTKEQLEHAVDFLVEKMGSDDLVLLPDGDVH